MKQECVLILGTLNGSRIRIVNELVKLDKKVVVIDTENGRNLKYPPNVTPYFVSSMDEKTILGLVKVISEVYEITHAGTIIDKCLETTGKVREMLKIPGFTFEKSLFFRDKGKMYELLRSNNIIVPKFEIFSRNDDKEKILSISDKFDKPFIVKPTTGSASSGVRLVESHNDLWDCLEKAYYDTDNYPYKRFDFAPWGFEWIMCDYIDGKEIAADIYVKNGEIAFQAIQEKPLMQLRGSVIEENSALMPSPSFSKKQLYKLNSTLKNIVKVIYQNIAKPCGVKYFPLYAEFRLNKKDCEWYCLEYTCRIGGAWGPFAIEKSTGVNMFEIAARSILELPTSIPSNISDKGVYWQILFSDRKGVFKGIEGLDKTTNLELLHESKKEYQIKVPHSVYLACIMTEGSSAKEAFYSAMDNLKKISLSVEDEEGKIHHIKIPTMEIL